MQILQDRIKLFLRSSLFIVLIFALVKLVLHLATAVNYGYFVDELYTIACGEHLSFGYVDIPPMAPFLSKISGLMFGYSLFSIHIFPALSGALLIVFTGLFVMELGGSRFAVLLACLAVLTAPVWLTMNSMLAYDNFDQLFTMIFFYLLLKLIKSDRPKMFLILGIIGGVCLLTKLTLAFAGIALAIALLLTKSRKYYASPWLWLAPLISLVIFSPYLFWQYSHQWPLIEYLNNYSQYGTYHAKPLEYLGMITLMINPLTLPLWLLGLYYYFFDEEGKKYSEFGIIPLFMFIILFIILKAKAYMIVAVFIPLIAGGCALLGKWIPDRKWLWLKTLVVCVFVFVGIKLLPLFIPLFSPEKLVHYYKIFNKYTGQVKTENSEISVLPQTMADRFGWDELVRDIAEVYHSLPAEDQKKCTIFGGSYGAAGAVDLMGGQYGLPKAVSGHLSYYIWGPGDNTGEILITAGVKSVQLRSFYEEITLAKEFYNPYTMPRNNVPIYICRKPNMNIQEAWKYIKNYQ